VRQGTFELMATTENHIFRAWIISIVRWLWITVSKTAIESTVECNVFNIELDVYAGLYDIIRICLICLLFIDFTLKLVLRLSKQLLSDLIVIKCIQAGMHVLLEMLYEMHPSENRIFVTTRPPILTSSSRVPSISLYVIAKLNHSVISAALPLTDVS
jgi:hypothetical protein